MVVLAPNHEGLNQRWSIEPDGQGNFYIISAINHNTFEVPDGVNAMPGVKLHVSMRNNTVNEKWSIVKFADAYNIKSAINGLCVCVAGGQCRPNDLI